ncbi:MAG: ABC transporter substrate-binding protein [Chloroflexi bacterium]|nr:ABC transporter substrate-binding protein [Chloroflexota bacterium]
MWRKRLATIVGLGAALTLIVAACGGGSDNTPTPAPAATKAPPTAAAPTAAPATAAPAATATAVPTATATPRPAATPTPTGPQPKYGGTMSVRVSGAFANDWDNYTANGRFAVLLTQNLLNNITYLDPVDGSTIRPDLAESWTTSADGLTTTYKVRRGVTFQDGAPLTAKDIAASLERARNPTNPASAIHKPRLAPIQTVTTPDDFTVVVTLSKPSASYFVNTSVPNLTVYSVAGNANIDAWKTAPVGTGPFKYKSLNRDKDADLVRNTTYWKTDDAGRKLPYLDAVHYEFIGDQALAFSAFVTGRLSCSCGYSSDILVSQKESAVNQIKGVKFGTTWSVNELVLNTSRAPFNSLAMRQAVNIAFDRQLMRDILRGGDAFYPPTYFVPRELGGQWAIPAADLLKMPGFREPKKQDVDQAKALLAQAGIDPTKLTGVKLYGNTSQKDISEGIQSILLQNLGLKIEIVSLANTADLTATLLRGDFDLNYTGGGNSFDDPADQITGATFTGGPLNYAKLSDPQVDQLLGQQDQTLDQAKRRDLLIQLQQRLLDLSAYFPIHTFPQLYAVQPYVEGFVLQRAFVVSAAHRLDKVWFSNLP